jgi:DNA replication protein DnaC
MAKRTKDIEPSLLDELRRNLERLRLFAMLAALDEALERAQTLEQGYATFLAGLVERQLLAVSDAASRRRIDSARFPATKTFDGFDFGFQKGLNVALVKDLMGLDFIRQGRPVLLLGKPGTGKTHLSIAFGHLAALHGYSVRYFGCKELLGKLYASIADGSTDQLVRRLSSQRLLIIDDLRDLPAKPEYASLLYDVVDARHLRACTMVSSNLSVKQWGKALGNASLTASLVDRLMERAHVVNIKHGKSYRTHGPDAPPESDRPDGLEPDAGD